MAATTAVVEGKLSKSLKKTIKKLVDKDVQNKLLVADAKIGNIIKEKYDLECIYSQAVQELMRGIRSQLDSLLSGVQNKELTAMTLGLAHSLSRYKLKFSPDKVDTMIIQAVCLLDDLDKELNNYIMRCREWYGWHFPELGKLITDNITFVKVIRTIGTRDNVAQSDLSDILPEELEEKVKEIAEISMGTEIAEEDILNIQHLCDQVIEISNYRAQLYEYLKSRMMAIAPNLTVLVGDLVGARLISHAGSLMNLAKHPASTVQILGAEKALFRALKAKKDTPKYGLIYHAQLIGQASTKNKGKISRMLAAKAALATRVDALGEDGGFDLGAEHKSKLEAILKLLEEGSIRRLSGTGKAKAKFEKYHGVSEIKQYQDAADSTLPSKAKRKYSETETGISPVQKKKKLKVEVKADVEDVQESKPKKKKGAKAEVKTEIEQVKVEPEGAEETPKNEKKKKKKNKGGEFAEEAAGTSAEIQVQGAGKKKKKKQKTAVDSEAME